MKSKKLDIWMIVLILMMYGTVVFFRFLSVQYYMESLVMLSALFTGLIISYFGGIASALAISAITVFFYGSFILYRNVILGYSVEPFVFFWLIALPASSVIMAVISSYIRKIQDENAELNKKCYDLVTVDEKTGLENVKVFYSVVNQNMGLSRRYKLPLCLMLVKLQYYHDIINLIGQSKINQLLKFIGQQLGSCTRIEDCVYILEDGCTFALILFSDAQGASVVKNRVKESIDQFKVENGNKLINVRIELKVGIAQYDESIKDVFALRKLAEKDMEFDV